MTRVRPYGHHAIEVKDDDVEKEVEEIKQDLGKLKRDVDVIREYMEDLRGWMMKTQDKSDGLSALNKGKNPMV